MTDYDKILWGFIFSTIGIAFGWILNQAGQWFRTRQEDKKSLKQVIYNLLETYHWFLRCDFDAIAKLISKKIFATIPKEQQTPQTDAELNKFYLDFVVKYLKPEVLEKLGGIEDGYQSSINSLASIDPVTAFYLSGKTSVLEKLDLIEQWYIDLQNKNPFNADEIAQGRKIAMGIIRPDILDSELLDLENDILKLTLKVNPVMWWRTKKTVRLMKQSVTYDMEKKIEELISKAQSHL